MTKAWNGRGPLLLVGAAALLFGCGNYTSDYVPPNDGRARAVWKEDRVVASIPANAAADCSDAISDVTGDPGRYVSSYGGSRTVVIWQPWIVVHHHHHPLPPPPGSPGVVRHPAHPSSGGGGGSIGSVSGGGGGGKSGGGGGSSGGGGGGDLGKAAVVLAVVALIALPIITLGLGLGRPEPNEVAGEIDQVNAYNDLARLPNSPCLVGAGAQGGE